MNSIEEILKLIKDIVISKGLSNYKLSEMTGLSAPAVNGLLNGKRIPNLKTFVAFCNALEITIKLEL